MNFFNPKNKNSEKLNQYNQIHNTNTFLGTLEIVWCHGGDLSPI